MHDRENLKATTTILPDGKLGWVTFVLFSMVICVASALEIPIKSLAELASQTFREREVAQDRLLDWGRRQREPAMAEFLRQSREAKDPEVRDRCLKILRSLVEDEYLKEGKGYIGISMEDGVADIPGGAKKQRAIRVTNVLADTPGARAGIKVNDMIIALNARSWQEDESYLVLREKVQAMQPNTKVELQILRNGELIILTVSLGRLPVFADPQLFNGQIVDPEAAERAAKEAHFRAWLSGRKPQH